MKMPGVLAPYASLIKWGLIAALSAFLFVSGCNHGENKSEKRLTQVEQNLAVCQEANASWAAAATERGEIAEDNRKEGERLQKVAVKDANKLEDSREDSEKTISNNQIKLSTALREPKCNELLEMMVCDAVPLP